MFSVRTQFAASRHALAAVLVLLVAAAVIANTLKAQTPIPDAGASLEHNSWYIGTPLPTPRDGAFAGAIGGKIYVAGGANNSGVLNVNEIYDTITNTWTTGAPMPTARCAALPRSLAMSCTPWVAKSATR
jgi:hypothetical protein